MSNTAFKRSTITVPLTKANGGTGNTNGTADTMTTPRNIFGVSFNGSADIGGNIELGTAGTTDTTVSRASAGVIAVEGVTVPTVSSTNVLTNKTITKRVQTTNAPGATPTTNWDNYDVFEFTGLNAAITSMTTNKSGTPVNGQMREYCFLDDGTARGITWGSAFVDGPLVILPTTTAISKMLRVLTQYQTAAGLNKEVCIAVA